MALDDRPCTLAQGPLAILLLVLPALANATPRADFAWLPCEATSVTHMRGEGMSRLKWLDGMQGTGLVPSCFAPLRAKVTSYSQV